MSGTDLAAWVLAAAAFASSCGARRGPDAPVDPRTLVDRRSQVVADSAADEVTPSGDPTILVDVVERLRAETCAVAPRVAVRDAMADPATEAEVARLDRLSRWLCAAGVHRVDTRWGADGTVYVEPGESGAVVAPGSLFVFDGFEEWGTAGTVPDTSIPACGGLIAAEPDLTVYLVDDLAVRLHADGEGVFVRVRDPDGRETCVAVSQRIDESGAVVDDGAPAEVQTVLTGGAGPHEVWVGAAAGGTAWELAASAPPTVGTGARTWRFGDWIETRVAVGPFSTAAPSNEYQWCSGFIGAVPSLRVYVPAEGWGGIAVASGGADSVLVVRGPNGELLCNDDFEGYDPRIDAWFAAGEWEVYVGSFGAGDTFQATLTLE